MAARICRTLLVTLLATSAFSSCHACLRKGDKRTSPVTDEELQKVSEALYRLDVNRARPGVDYVVNTRGPKLFTYLNTSLLKRPTYAKLKGIQDLYTVEVGVAEPVCPPCSPQENAFLDAVMQTSVMTKTHQFLKSKGLAAPSRYEFRAQLMQWWMLKYSRSEGKAKDSSGFEHVFAADLMGDTVGGLHNWVYYYYKERSGQAKYKQFIESCKPEILTFAFSFRGKLKPRGGFALSSSPELEMALATLCFRVRPQEGQQCLISLGGNILNMHTYTMPGVKPKTLSSAYPICLI